MMVSGMKIVGNDRGYSLTEMLVVIAILSILLGIAGLSFRTMSVRYQVETQVREMFADMMNARIRANAKNRASFVTITATTYQITEDTNESGGTEPDAGDIPFFATPKQLNYPVLSGDAQIILDTKGVVSTDGGPISPDPTASLSVLFNTYGETPAYDCILLGPTRINMGKWDGTYCVAK